MNSAILTYDQRMCVAANDTSNLYQNLCSHCNFNIHICESLQSFSCRTKENSVSINTNYTVVWTNCSISRLRRIENCMKHTTA